MQNIAQMQAQNQNQQTSLKLQNNGIQANKLANIGRAVINQNVNDLTLPQSEIIQYKQILQKQEWSIKYGDFTKQNLKKYFQIIVESSIQQLSIYSNQHSEILKEIEHVSFPNLKIIWLFQNNIMNIEAICWMNFPILQAISFGKNKICNIGCFKKLLLPELHSFNLLNNPIKCIQSLSKAKFTQKQMRYFPLQYNEKDLVSCQSINCIIKMNPRKMPFIHIKNQQSRIMQQKIIIMFERRNYFPKRNKE